MPSLNLDSLQSELYLRLEEARVKGKHINTFKRTIICSEDNGNIPNSNSVRNIDITSASSNNNLPNNNINNNYIISNNTNRNSNTNNNVNIKNGNKNNINCISIIKNNINDVSPFSNRNKNSNK